jgi:hypothetical protein
MPFVLLLLAFVSVTASPVRPALSEQRPFSWHEADENGSVRVNLYFFWSATCPHCHRGLRLLGTLEEEMSWLDVLALEISEPENAELYATMAEQLGTEARYVPAFFFCGRWFQGYQDDQTTGRFLRESLEACRAEAMAKLEADTGPASDPAAVPAPAPIDLPLVGRLDESALSLPVLTVVLAGLDAFNPCAFFVLLFLLSLMVHARSRARMAVVGGVFVLCSGLVYFGFMAAWLNLFLLVGYLPLVTTAAGVVAILLGLVNIKDFVWLKRGISLSIPERAKPGLYQRMGKLVGAANLPGMLAATVALALAANAYELLCTAGFPMVFTRLLTLAELSRPAYYGYLALYNAVYVLPMLAIVAAFVVTLGARKLTEEEARILKLLSGNMMLGLGFVLLFTPEALSDPMTALALAGGALAVTALVACAVRRRNRVSRAAP